MKPSAKLSPNTRATLKRERLDFPALRIGGPAVENYVRHLIWPKLNRGQFVQTLLAGSRDPFKLLLPATYDQFDSAHVQIPANLRKEFWQPAFYVSVRGDLVSAERWEDQYVSVVPVFILGTIDLGDARLLQIIAEMIDATAALRTISVRELFQASDRLVEQPDREKVS